MWRIRRRAVRGILQMAALAVVLLGCPSCARLEAVPITAPDAQQLIGQDIRVTTIDGQVLEFRLLDVTEDALGGDFQHVRFEDVALLERRGKGLPRDACLLAGGMVGAAAGALLVIVWFLYEFAKSI